MAAVLSNRTVQPGEWKFNQRADAREEVRRGPVAYMFEQMDIAPVRVQGRFWSGSK
jgi:hypothetical protein